VAPPARAVRAAAVAGEAAAVDGARKFSLLSEGHMSFQNNSRLNFKSAALATAAGTILIGFAVAASDGETFTSPDLAAQALLHAAESSDSAGLLKILGPSANEILTTSDPVADSRTRAAFVKKAKQKMLVVSDPYQPDQKILEIGTDKWPFPIPLIQTADKNWQFDVDQGKEAILLRRIGNNEITVIDLSRGYVEAQNQYFERDRTGKGVRQYAQKFISSDGQRDGLFWKSTDPNDQSPVAEMVAHAIAEGYTKQGEPYHGYRFKILTGQGAHASGGAMNYLDNGAMTHGFALIAWPAEYRSTGIMTFLVDRSGIVYQKDLGAKTAQIANATTVYDPDQTWTPVAGSGVPEKRISQNRSR
jgi:hypothetical protein